MQQVIERAGDYNILVMLDSHRLNDREIPELWYKYVLCLPLLCGWLHGPPIAIDPYH